MDPILFAFGVVAAALVIDGVRAWWRGRAWIAALCAVLAGVALSPFSALAPPGVIVAGLLVLVGVVGWLLWPRRHSRAPQGSDEPAEAGEAGEPADGRRDLRRGGRS